MLKTDLTIQTHGKPSLQAMPESERRSSLGTLFDRIIDLQQKRDSSQNHNWIKTIEPNRKSIV